MTVGLGAPACDPDDDGGNAETSGGGTSASTGLVASSGEASETAMAEGGADSTRGASDGDVTSDASSSGGGQSVADYCNCVFGTCHDAYHARWGEDEVVSRMACEAEAEALTDEALLCRIEACQVVAADSECEDSIAPDACG